MEITIHQNPIIAEDFRGHIEEPHWSNTLNINYDGLQSEECHSENSSEKCGNYIKPREHLESICKNS